MEDNKNVVNECEEAVMENTPIPNVPKTKGGQGVILSIISLAAVAILCVYVLFFMKKENASPVVMAAGESSGLILTVNQDSVLEHFVLVNLLKTDLETEAAKYQAELERKSAAFEEKYRNYMINVQNQVLTQTQMQNTEKLLIDEKTTLENLSAKYSEIMGRKKMSVDREILDSITNAVKRVNDASYRADYVFATAEGSAIIYSKPAHDITSQVITELNNAYNRTHKK